MSWIAPRGRHETERFVGKLIETISSLGGTVSRKLCELYLGGRVLDIIDYQFDYDDVHLDVNDLIYARQIQALFSKREDLDLGVDQEQVAWMKFLESEEKCRQTNERFDALSRGEFYFPPDVSSVLHLAQQKISEILGTLPSLCDMDFSFGPGANTSVKAAEASSRAKLSARLECSANLAPVVGKFLSEFPLWTQVHTNSGMVSVNVSAGKLQFVPKDARTHRSIVVEPILNSVYQKGFGSYMKRRLRRFGIDLSDQTRNQELARRASIDGTLCTIDLSAASDCLSRGLIWDLLPFSWAEALDYGRTPYVTYRSETLLLEKFSSMGNAFTFELETMIFHSLAYGSCKTLGVSTDDLSVYGDDIIIPVAAFDLLVRSLELCGFSCNIKKTYNSGPFRESCGTDWFRGIAVRPFYLRNEISGQILFVFHNFLVRNGEWQLARVVKSFIRPHHRIYGPDGYGDGHLLGSYHLRQSRKLRKCGYEGGFFDSFVLNPRRIRLERPGDWVYPSYCAYVQASREGPVDPDIVRGTKGYRRASIYTLARRVFSPNL